MLKCALRTLYEEIAEFRFDYPLMPVPGAGPKESLYPYLYKDNKRPPYRSVMRLDSNGIARVWYRVTGVVYRPAFVAMYGSNNLGHYLRSGNQAYLNIFLNQVNWLEQHAVIRSDGAVVWPHDFDLQEGPILLRAPWVSANVQGVEGLRYFLPRWDYRKKWSLYSNGAYLCPPGYHCLNRMLLIVLARLTGDSYFAEYAEAWNPAHLSLLGRAEIYLAFLLTKNACRLKHRTWRHRTTLISTQFGEIRRN